MRGRPSAARQTRPGPGAGTGRGCSPPSSATEPTTRRRTPGDADPDVLDAVRRATDAGQRLRDRLLPFDATSAPEREGGPLRLSARDGHWYLRAWCHRAGGVRSSGRPHRHRGADRRRGRRPPERRTGRRARPERRPTGGAGRRRRGRVDRRRGADRIGDHRRRRPDPVVLRVTAEPGCSGCCCARPTVEARDVDTGDDLRPLGATSGLTGAGRYR